MTEKAAIYCRISLDAEGESLGVQRQEDDCRTLAARLGVDVAEVFIDNDIGASTRSRAKTRPAYDRMMEQARAGRFAYVLAYSNSRLTRRPMELEAIINLHESTGVRFATVVSGEDNLSTADGRMVARIKASVDAAEAERTAERVARKHLQNARDGKPVGGTRPFGWKKDKITIKPREAALIRQAATDVLEGVPIREVCRRWNEAGVTTSTGRQWQPATLRQMLKSPRLAGWRIHRGAVATDTAGRPVRGQWEAILDDDLHGRLVAFLSRPEGRSRIPRRGARHYLLTGVLRCGATGCNRPMYGNARTVKGERTHYYSCSGHGHTVSASPEVEKYVTELLLADLAREDAVPVAVASFDGAERLREIDEQILELMTAFKERRLSSGIAFGMVEELEGERDALQADKRRWEAAQAGPRVVKMDRKTWSGIEDVNRKRAIIERRFEAVLILPATKRGNTFDGDRVIPIWREV